MTLPSSSVDMTGLSAERSTTAPPSPPVSFHSSSTKMALPSSSVDMTGLSVERSATASPSPPVSFHSSSTKLALPSSSVDMTGLSVQRSATASPSPPVVPPPSPIYLFGRPSFGSPSSAPPPVVSPPRSSLGGNLFGRPSFGSPSSAPPPVVSPPRSSLGGNLFGRPSFGSPSSAPPPVVSPPRSSLGGNLFGSPSSAPPPDARLFTEFVEFANTFKGAFGLPPVLVPNPGDVLQRAAGSSLDIGKSHVGTSNTALIGKSTFGTNPLSFRKTSSTFSGSANRTPAIEIFGPASSHRAAWNAEKWIYEPTNEIATFISGETHESIKEMLELKIKGLKDKLPSFLKAQPHVFGENIEVDEVLGQLESLTLLEDLVKIEEILQMFTAGYTDTDIELILGGSWLEGIYIASIQEKMKIIGKNWKANFDPLDKEHIEAVDGVSRSQGELDILLKSVSG